MSAATAPARGTITAGTTTTDAAPHRHGPASTGAALDAAWDDFLRHTPGGSYRQTTAWAHAKAFQGWEAKRIVVRRDGRIVAGAQLLTRPLPVAAGLGRIGYCAKGPLLGEDDVELADRIVEQLRRFCRRERVQVLIVQPPGDSPSVETVLRRAGWVPSPVPVAPEATVLIDLSRDLDVIERQLPAGLRRKLRRAARDGLEVRRGTRGDLTTFHELLTKASERIGYTIFPLAYYERLWDAFAGQGELELLIAEHGGRPVSAHLCQIFGDTVHGAAMAWSGELAKLTPNDVLAWRTIGYAKERGLRWFDLESFSPDAARLLAEGTPLAELRLKGSDRFKLKWSQHVVAWPRPYLYVSHAGARALLRLLPPERLAPWLKQLRDRFRPVERATP